MWVRMCCHLLIIGSTYEEYQLALSVLINLLISLGFPINWNKVCGPSTTITFLGVTLDLIPMRAELPYDKICKLHSLLDRFLVLKKAGKCDLQSLASVLSFASTVIEGGRCFSRHVFDLIGKFCTHIKASYLSQQGARIYAFGKSLRMCSMGRQN